MQKHTPVAVSDISDQNPYSPQNLPEPLKNHPDIAARIVEAAGLMIGELPEHDRPDTPEKCQKFLSDNFRAVMQRASELQQAFYLRFLDDRDLMRAATDYSCPSFYNKMNAPD